MTSKTKVTIASAVKLDKDQIIRIVNAVKTKKNNSEVELKELVDPSLIGGIKVTVDSRQWDATVYASLEKVHQSLKQSL